MTLYGLDARHLIVHSFTVRTAVRSERQELIIKLSPFEPTTGKAHAIKTMGGPGSAARVQPPRRTVSGRARGRTEHRARERRDDTCVRGQR